MKRNYSLMLLTLIFLFSGCRQEALSLEHEHSHKVYQPYISFSKFSRLTHLDSQTFRHSFNAKGIPDVEDYDIDTVHIRQTLRNDTVTAFSFRIKPKNTQILKGNIFYNLAYVKTGAEWQRYIVKYEAQNPEFLTQVAINPSIGFKGTTTIISESSNDSSRLYTCIVSMQQYRQNCPQGHVVIEQCYQESPNCCRSCWGYVDYSIMPPVMTGAFPEAGQ